MTRLRRNRRIMSRIMVLFLILGLILPGLASVVVVAEGSDAPQVEVSFDSQGGSGTMASIFCNPLDEVTLPENGFTEPEGKSFKVWEIDGQEYAPGAVVTVPTNTIVKAVWKDVEDGLSELSGNVSAAAEEPGKDSLSEGKAGQDADTDIESELQEPNGQEETSSSVKVASVNGIQYETLQAAIDAAAEGDTVSLLVDRTEWVEVNKTLTLDLSGHTLRTRPTAGENHPAITITGGSFPTIQNGTISVGPTRAEAIEANGALFNLSDLTITGCNGPEFAIWLWAFGLPFDDPSMNINNLTVSNNKSNVIYAQTHSNITFTDCNFDNNLTDGSNRLLTIGGRGNKKFNNCTFLNNMAQGIADVDAEFIGCRFEGNECKSQSTVKGSNIILENSVVKNNICTHAKGVAGVEAKNLTLTNSAVYGNKNTAGGRNDLGENCQNIDVTQMKDPTNPTMDFSNYVVSKDGRVLEEVEVFEAEIGDTKYERLTEAVEAAQAGDTIKLINSNEAGDIKPVSVNTVGIERDITIDLNGRDVTNSDVKLFCLAGKAGKLSLINSSDQVACLYGEIHNDDKDSTLQIGDKIIVYGQIYHNEKTIIDGSHHRLDLMSREDLGVTMPVTFGVNFEYTGEPASLAMSLAESKDDLNDPKTPVPEIVIAHNAGADLADKISLQGITNPLVKVVFRPTSNSSEFGDLVVKKELSSTVYLNGKKGDDTASGLAKDTAVKTFAQAKKLAEGLAQNNENEKVFIYVCDTVVVDAQEEWSFSDKDKIMMYREPDFFGNLVKIGAQGNLTLKNITIDGNKKNAYAEKSSLIKVEGGTLSILTGASLQNNKLTDLNASYTSKGGAVYASGTSTVNLEGGTISGNTAVWGGGIFANGATINIQDRPITQNEAVNSSDDNVPGGGAVYASAESMVNLEVGTISGNIAAWGGGIFAENATINIEGGCITQNNAFNTKDYRASGGGIATRYQSVVNISGGTISHNFSEGNGGGLSLGVFIVETGGNYSELKMSGGDFIGNTAQSSGGGLFVQGGIGEGYSRAYVKGGLFENNKALEGFFGGGGIYVNGGHDRPGYKSGKLYLTNALITRNTADGNGGGYAACRTSNTVISAKNGPAIIANEAKHGGGDIYIDAITRWGNNTGNPVYSISDSILGDTPCHWMIDDCWMPDDGTEVPLQSLYGKLNNETWLNLKNQVPEEAISSDLELFKVTIIENHAGHYGGGIGSNGDVYIGTSEVVELNVNKIWDDQDNIAGKRPQSIKVGLYRTVEGSDEEPMYIGYNPIKEDAEGNWTTTFNNLPKSNKDGKLFVYTVKEIFDPLVPLEYLSESNGSVSGKNGTIEIVNTYETIEVAGSVTWNDNNDQAGKRPQSITIRLWKNGVEIDSKTVTEADGWAWRFTDLAKYENGKLISYTITEDAIDGYSSEVSGYNVINSYSPDKPTEPTTPIEPMEPTSLSEPTKTIISTEPMKSTTPAESTKPTGPALLPRAGENSDPYLWLSIMCMSVGTSLLLFRRKNTK